MWSRPGKARQAEREAAEVRLAELDGIERDLQADAESVDRLRATWGDWHGALEAEPEKARQTVKGLLAAPVYVRPTGRGGWTFAGVGHYDGVLHGTVLNGVGVAHGPHPADRLRAFAERALQLGQQALGVGCNEAGAPRNGPPYPHSPRPGKPGGASRVYSR